MKQYKRLVYFWKREASGTSIALLIRHPELGSRLFCASCPTLSPVLVYFYTYKLMSALVPFQPVTRSDELPGGQLVKTFTGPFTAIFVIFFKPSPLLNSEPLSLHPQIFLSQVIFLPRLQFAHYHPHNFYEKTSRRSQSWQKKKKSEMVAAGIKPPTSRSTI